MRAGVLLKRREDAVAKARAAEAGKASAETGATAERAAAGDDAPGKAGATASATVSAGKPGAADGTSSTGKVDAAAPAPGSTSRVLPDAGAPSSGRLSLSERVRRFVAPYLFPQVMPYLAISFARRLPKGFCIAFVLIFARSMGIASGAMFFVAAGATTLICRLCGGKLFDSGRTWLLLPLISVQVVGFIALSAAPSFATLIFAAVTYGISVGTTSPLIKTTVAKSTPKEHWGVVNGEVYFFGDLGKAIGAFAGGLIIDATSKALVPEIALGFALFTSTVTAIALLIGRRIGKRGQCDA